MTPRDHVPRKRNGIADHPLSDNGSHDARPHDSLISRRQMLHAGFFGVLGASLVLRGWDLADPTPRESSLLADDAEPTPQLQGDGFLVRAEGKRPAILLCTAEGTPVQRFRGFRFREIVFTSGVAVLAHADDGAAAIRVDYAPVDDVAGTVRAHFIPRGRKLEITFDFHDFESLTPKEGMILRETYSRDPVVETAHGVFDWERDPRGGVPFQRSGRFVYVQERDGAHLALVTKGSATEWRDNRALHLPPTELSSSHHRSTLIAILGDESRPPILDAVASDAPLAGMLATSPPYNIWEGTDDSLPVTASVFNGGDVRDVELRWIAHDFDGGVVSEGSRTLRMETGAVSDVEVQIALRDRGIAFVELSARSQEDETYTRTNVAVLPAHEYGDDAAASMFGIAAAYLFGPPEERALLRRIGVRRSRHTYFSEAELQKYGFTQHRMRTPQSLDAFDGDAEGLDTYVAEELDRAEEAGATHYELANELNRWGEGAFSGDGAALYVQKWVRAFRRGIRGRASDIGLIAVGLAGMDVPYARAMFEADLAEYADAFNLHPGRGNVTPDYAPDWQAVESGEDRSWNYFGALKEARALIDAYAPGGMELWLTEVYACTRPNAWWDDSYRHAAENIVLSAALALSVGVTSMMWFQLYDNIKANPYGARPYDREHHFGLLLRDLSPKPSLLAYAAAAENLDGADFRRWIEFDDENVRGMLFSTPRGPLALLWYRADGHRLNTEEERDESFYPTPEPWIDTWATHKTMRLRTTAEEVVEVDCIGRRRVLAAHDSVAQITIDGAVRMYYGLDTTDLRTAVNVPGGHRQI
ncbi:hypothetical protein N8K70_13360 [Microbacterium betulae]|uniref:Uncharacterized protein n=1 Tax=Microbacterium betulae TaxID=2981139 RepID=A0AA97I687_9MICO|nr:hypothetical protein [Microbacterium sp. AB]WOF22367.1 hypothetical protein N8K70_13360 [Microbacterium sp. AB]